MHLLSITTAAEELPADSWDGFHAFADRLATEGVPVAHARGFATWMEKLYEKHMELVQEHQELVQEHQELQEDYQDLKEAEAPIPQAATFYHPTREAALAAAGELKAKDPRIEAYGVELEPYNGWMIALTPARCDLSAYQGLAEICDGRRQASVVGKNRPTPINAGRTAPKPAKGGEGPSPSGAAPTKGATALVWTIADRVYGEKGLDRAAIIAACEAEGINTSTAGTQYSKWKKSHGY